jgi:hypothetical protein
MAGELALAEQPLTNDDIITYIVAELGQEYDSLAPQFPHGLILSAWRNSFFCFSSVNHGSIIIINPFKLPLLPIWSPHNPSNTTANLEHFNTPIIIGVIIVVEDVEDIFTFMIPTNHNLLSVRYASNQAIVF